jgi:protein-disulfide isomerase
MRKGVFLAFLVFFLRTAVCAASPSAAAAGTARDRIAKYFAGWFSYCPETRVTAKPVPELTLAGLEAYSVERTCSLKNRNDMTVTLYDPAKNEIFVGEVLHDDTRKGRPFSETKDLPVLQGVLGDAYGMRATIAVGAPARGPLKPIQASLAVAEGATAPLAGFVSEDGATLLIGGFRSLDVAPDAYRQKMLAESPGVRPRKGAYYVTAFVDFQCEKCRQRSPQVADFVWSHGGGAIEYRFLPMVKVHDWAFAAAETGAALANVAPELYARYEQTVFPQASAMTPSAARQAGADVAEAAGVGAAFREELSSGRARQRVARDVGLAMRLGLNGTPVFFYEGAFLTSDTGLAEGYIEGRLRGAGAPPAAASGRP